ncbi:hypothetical protein [Paenibacillus sp. GP183]|uniref:hypothetical protein n=1 Tax=Paenibacillus sp. GP183 TaxID=1882751 RepID=UPI000899D768|nr:hypothetical protein [Paenibacillus sp. GP183]SEB99583.1 hypothetical protein SAMN05443246_2602 [Paenibacillus sp. GP183]
MDYENIKRIEASVWGYFGSSYNVEVDLLNGKVIWSEGLYKVSEYVKQADTESMNTFIYGINNCRILNWEKNYNNLNILDGTHWSLKIELDDRIIEKSGSNAYPNEWEKFCNIIQKLTGKPFD